jgi:hypothetical protein
MPARIFPQGILPRTLSLAVALAAATGCADSPPWVQSASADRIVLRWYPRDIDTGQGAAQAKAEAHCAQTGRQALLVTTGMSGSIQIAIYQCQ